MACKTYEIDANGKKIREITDAELKQRILEDDKLYKKVKPVLKSKAQDKFERSELLKAEPLTMRELIMQYFLGGGKIQTKSLTDETGFKGKSRYDESIRGLTEWRKRIWMHTSDAPTMDDLIQTFKEDWANDFGGDNLEDSAIRDEIIDVINRNTTPSDLSTNLKESMSVNGKVFSNREDRMIAQQEAEMAERYELDQDDLSKIEDEDLGLVANELNNINEGILTKEEIDKQAKEYDDYYNSLSDAEKELENKKLLYEKDNSSDSRTESKKNDEVESAKEARKQDGEKDGKSNEPRAEAEKQQPNKEAGEGEVSEEQKVLDRLAEAKRKREEFAKNKNKLGAVKDGFSEAEEQAKIDRELFDAYVDVAKVYIKKGIKSAKEWADAIGEELTQTLKNAWDEANSGSKKRVLTERAYEGKVREDVKTYLAERGLYREKFTQEQRKAQAKEYIETFGEEIALESVKYGEARGALAAAILTETQKSINAERLKLKNTDTAKLDELAQKEAEIISILGEYAYEGGEYNAYLDKVYREDADLGYSYERKVKEWKDLNNGEISPEVEAKFKDLDNQMQELKKKIADAEERLKEEQAKQAFEDIVESVKRKPTQKDKIEAKKEKARALKSEGLSDLADALGWQLSAVGDKRATAIQGLVKIGKGLIIEGEANIDNVIDKLKIYVKNKFGNKASIDDYESDLRDAFEKERSKATINDKNEIKIPRQAIRDAIESGVKDINELTKYFHKQLLETDSEVTEREVRDAITKYGKVINPSSDEISKQIRKMTSIGRILSQLEDIANKKRPLKSGQQRDKMDAEQRAKYRELREALKDMPLDEDALADEIRSMQDTKKARLQNRIEDLQREIDTKTKTEKSKKDVPDNDDIKRLREELEKVKAEHDKEFASQNEAEKEAKRINTIKKNTQRRIEDLQRRLRDKDFSQREKKPSPVDDEVRNLKADKLRIQDEYDKEFYKNKLLNRTKAEKWKDRIWDAWGLTRALQATADLSFIGVQGLKMSIAHPKTALQALKTSYNFFKSEKRTEEWLRDLRAQEYYPIMKESKLAITEPNAEVTAREELFNSGWTNMLWDAIGYPLTYKSESAYESWVKANPMKALERAAVGYLDTLRVQRFLDGMEMLQEKGLPYEGNEQAYKDMADVINTLTGRASLGIGEQFAPQLSKIFFSPRNWASAFKTATPYGLYHFGKMRAGAEGYKPSVAQKMAMADIGKFAGITTGFVMMAAAKYNNDDDETTSVEFDPRSSDFMKIKIGNKRIDPYGGMLPQIVLTAKLASDFAYDFGFGEGAVKTKKGEIIPLGVPYKSPTKFEAAQEMAMNKLAPSAQILYNYASAKRRGDGKVNKYGNKYEFKEDVLEHLYPIYFGTFKELIVEDPSALNGLLAFYAFLGGGVQDWETKKQREKEEEREKLRTETRSRY